MSWHGEKHRHSLASRGIRSLIKDVRLASSFYTVDNNPYTEYRKVYGMNYYDYYLKDIEWQRDVDDTIEQSVEDYVYHTTDAKNLENIIKFGLVSDFEQLWEESKSCNYFSEYPAYSVLWYIRHLQASGKLNQDYQKEKEHFIVLRIPHQKLDLEEDYTGMTSEYGNSYCSENNVSPGLIEIKTRDGWISLK